MNPFLVLILSFLVLSYLLDQWVERSNLSCIQTELPSEFKNFYSPEKYQKAQAYLKESTQYALFRKTLYLPLTIGFIWVGGFAIIDRIVSAWGYGLIETGLLYFGVIAFMMRMINLPFSYYETFVLEQKYGFNQTTLGTFVGDWIKSFILGAVIGGVMLAGVIWFFQTFAVFGWFLAWLALTVFQLFLTFVAPIWIMPLFNRFSPIQDGELKKGILDFTNKVNFKLDGIFTMNGSKRSSKANAFFTGFGKHKRIVLFDTLIKSHTQDELVSVLAHEVGHYQEKHIFRMFLVSFLMAGVMFYLLHLVLFEPELYLAFGMEEPKVYAGLLFSSMLYSPLSRVFGLLGNVLSRKHEFEADAYAVRYYEKPMALIDALKRLSVDHLSNLNPHPVKVFFDYSHPPILKRVQAIHDRIKETSLN